MLSDHLVTVNDDEVIVSSTIVTLPELEEAATKTMQLEEDESESVDRRSSSNHDLPDFASNNNNNTFSPLESTPENNNNNNNTFSPPCHSFPMSAATSPASFPTPTTTNNNNNMIPVQHKLLYQCVSSFASPLRTTQQDQHLSSNLLLNVGQEREVLFHTDSLGIKLSRHTDGYVRVLSVTPYRAATNNYHQGGLDEKQQQLRTGEIYAGDVVREVCGVDLRYPIDSAVWKMTVGLMKMAPRPLQFVVARELPRTMEEKMEPKNEGTHLTASSSNNKMLDSYFGPTREVHFLESCLGVKLHHSSEGYVQILSVTPYKSFPNSPLARIGEVYAGDIVLQVGGVWDLREPIDDTTWGVLIKFIRETRRPLSMVVAEGDCLEAIEQEEEEEEEKGGNLGEEDNGQLESDTCVETSDANQAICCAEEQTSDDTSCGADQDHQSDEDKVGSDENRSDGELPNVCQSLKEQTVE